MYSGLIPILVVATSVALGGLVGWTVQGWRFGEFKAQVALAREGSERLQTKERLRSVEQSITDNQYVEAKYDKLQIELRNAQVELFSLARANRRSDAIDGLLQQTCSGNTPKVVQPTEAKKRVDAIPPGWELNQWFPGFR